MGNFAVAAADAVVERGKKVLDTYSKVGDKNKEAALIRILDLAETEAVRGTHPELSGKLRAIEATIATLIKQIDGIVAGQDLQLEEAEAKINSAVSEKNAALLEAAQKTTEAQAQKEAADDAMKQAESDSALAKKQATEAIEAAQSAAAAQVEKANVERNQALRERDDARTISAEKTSSNDLLMRQMAAMEADVAAYKELQTTYATAIAEKRQMEEEKKDLERKLNALEADHARELERLAKENAAALDALNASHKQRMETAAVQASLDAEKAMIARERELQALYQDRLQAAYKENALLLVKIEQMEQHIAAIENPDKN